jgi:hypothetical protein
MDGSRVFSYSLQSKDGHPVIRYVSSNLVDHSIMPPLDMIEGEVESR